MALRFLGWLVAEGKIASADSLVAVFASPKIAGAAKMYVEHLVGERGNKWSYAANVVISIISISRFCFGVKKARGAKAIPPVMVDDAPMKQLAALHRQAVQQKQREAKFDTKAVNFLDWAAVQRARVSAEEELLKGDCDRLYALRDVLLMALLTGQPPDRVGALLLFPTSRGPAVTYIRAKHTLARRCDAQLAARGDACPQSQPF